MTKKSFTSRDLYLGKLSANWRLLVGNERERLLSTFDWLVERRLLLALEEASLRHLSSCLHFARQCDSINYAKTEPFPRLATSCNLISRRHPSCSCSFQWWRRFHLCLFIKRRSNFIMHFHEPQINMYSQAQNDLAQNCCSVYIVVVLFFFVFASFKAVIRHFFSSFSSQI